MAHRTDKTKGEDPATNQEAHRNAAKTGDYKGEAQNVNDDEGRPLDTEDLEHARNKATEGLRQGRDDSTKSRNNEVNRGENDQLGRG
jgi:hypothetical protein